jgi:hypothetical protein
MFPITMDSHWMEYEVMRSCGKMDNDMIFELLSYKNGDLVLGGVAVGR